MKNARRLAIAMLVVVATLPVQVATAGASTAEEPQAPGLVATEVQIFKSCIALAQELKAGPWTCGGDGLTYLPSADAGVDQAEFVPVAADTVPDVSTPPKDGAAINDDYDGWCENAGTCSRRVTAYVAETKGNLVYGYSSQTIGTFDVISRTNLNGTQPRWRVSLIWDAGPGIAMQDWYKQCRRNVTGPDPSCGTFLFYPLGIGPGHGRYRTDYPSTTGYINGNALARNDDYHDDTYGDFFPDGWFVFRAATMKGRDWNCDSRADGSRYCIFP